MRRPVLPLALLAVSAPIATLAQQPQTMPARQAEVELAGYADCVVSHKAYRAPVDRFLRVVPDSEGFFPASMKAADMHCLDAAALRTRSSKMEMRLQPGTFRDALYPALYRRDFGKAGPVAGIAAVPPMVLTAEFDGNTETLSQDYRPRRALGDCVSRAQPQGAHDLLLSTPYSPKEDAAVEVLKPALADCLSEGHTLRMNRTALRASVGEAMYKLSRVAANSKT